eukprot:SM000401S15612  [mRNA]  locus=s401:13212:18632:+ [translate_table: standard]
MDLPPTYHSLEHRRGHSNDCERQAHESNYFDSYDLSSAPLSGCGLRRRGPPTAAEALAGVPSRWHQRLGSRSPRRSTPTEGASHVQYRDAAPRSPIHKLDANAIDLQIQEPAPAQTEATASRSTTRAQVSRKGRGSESIGGMQPFGPSDKELVGYYLRKKLEGTLSPQEEAFIPDSNRDPAKDVTIRSTFTLLGWDKLINLIHLEEMTSAGKFSCRFTRAGCSRQLQPKMYEYEILTVDRKGHLQLAIGALVWTSSDAGQTSGQVTEGESESRPAGSSPPDVFMHGTYEDEDVASPQSTDRPDVDLKINCSQDGDLKDTFKWLNALTSQFAASSLEVSMHLLCKQLLIV